VLSVLISLAVFWLPLGVLGAGVTWTVHGLFTHLSAAARITERRTA